MELTSTIVVVTRKSLVMREIAIVSSNNINGFDF